MDLQPEHPPPHPHPHPQSPFMDFLTIFTKKKRIAAATAINAIPQTISETKEKTSLVNDKGYNPCNDKHQYSSKDGELP